MVRDHVHAYIHGIDDAPEHSGCGSRQVCVAAILEDFEATSDPGCPSNTGTGGSCTIEVGQGALAGQLFLFYLSSPHAEVAELADAPS